MGKLRPGLAVVCLALLLSACGEKEEPATGTSNTVVDSREFTGEKAEVAETVERYLQLLADEVEKATLCSRVIDLGGPHGRGSRQARQTCMRNPDLGLVVRGAGELSVQSIQTGKGQRAIDERPIAFATAGGSGTQVKIRLRLGGPFWRVAGVEIVGLRSARCQGLQESEIADGFGTRHPNSGAALADGIYGDAIARAVSRGAAFVPIAETSSSWTWALRKGGVTVAEFTVEGEPPIYYSTSRDACQAVAASDSAPGGSRGFPPPPGGSGPCKDAPPPGAPGTQNGPPPTVRMPAEVWATEGGVIRAMYPGSGSNEPCGLGIAAGSGGRVVIRILNPAVATSDLRYWCVEARLPPAAPDLSPATSLKNVQPGIRRQLRSGRGCVRVPYGLERRR